jgi:hydroxyacyl-ACP dehydratase HTD2-like protein with hotdog domain
MRRIAKFGSLRDFHQSRTLADQPPSEIADAFMSKFGKAETTRYQRLDSNQINLLWLTLNRDDSRQVEERKAGVPGGKAQPFAFLGNKRSLPPGWHLAYFTPDQPLADLAVDGTDTQYNPEAPFTRRMWAGGSIEWPRPKIQASPPGPHSRGWELQLGDVATESTRVLSCMPKTIRKTGETMLVVGVKKVFRSSFNPSHPQIIEHRDWIFRRALDPSKPAPEIPPKPAVLDEAALDVRSRGKLVRKFNRTVPELFRFSAVTFNAHRIHYDREWARQVEGHRDIVVHGPLNMISILDFWRDAQEDSFVHPSRLDYRATSPIYVNEPYRILMDADAATKDVTDVLVVSDDGTVCMVAQIAR